MGKVLDAAAMAQFRRDGLYAPVQVASGEEARRLRAQLEAGETDHGGPFKGAVRYKSHLLFKWLSDFIRKKSVLDPVEDILGPNIMVWSTDWWVKEANSPSYVSWHQDSQYWGLDSSKLITLWVALSPSNVASGCMRYLLGSHLGPDLPHRETYHDDNMLTRGQEITEGIDEAKAVNVELDPGEGSIFAFRIAHASHTPTAPPTAASDWRSASFRRTPDRSGPTTTAPPSCGASTRTVISNWNRSPNTTSTPLPWNSTGGRRKNDGRSSTTAPIGKRTGPDERQRAEPAGGADRSGPPAAAISVRAGADPRCPGDRQLRQPMV